MANEPAGGILKRDVTRRLDLRRPVARRGAMAASLASVLCLIGLVAIPQAVQAQTSPASVGSPPWAPIVGTWYVPTYFNYGPYQGQTENTLMTFSANGGLVEANPINYSAANQGNWSVNSDGTYNYNLIEFSYDPATHGVCQAVDARITIKITQRGSDGLPIGFASTSTAATLNNYNPQTGQLTSSIPLPNITIVKGARITAGTGLPSSFAAEPPPPSPAPCS